MPTDYFREKNGALNLTAEPQEDAVPVKLQYLNEGGANFIFTINRVHAHDEVPTQLQHKLLRLRKQIESNNPITAARQLEVYTEHFAPLFPKEHQLSYELINLETKVIDGLNEYLNRIDRPANRRGDDIAIDETHGTLITDMRAGEDETLLQLKPKWLAQSPTAPPNARRCRTCALRAQRAAKKVRTATDAQESCPLDLITWDAKARLRAASALTHEPRAQYFLANDAQPLLHTLAKQQKALDPRGATQVLAVEDMLSLTKAMTMRDCTLFMLQKADGNVEARLGDLDMKAPGKLERWSDVERRLIQEGWYVDAAEESICALSRR